MAMPPVLHLVAVAVAGVALLFVIIGVAIPKWLYSKQNGVESSYGLWQKCNTALHVVGVTDVCDLGVECSAYKLDNEIAGLKRVDKDFFTPTRGLEMFGLLVLAGAIVVSVVHMLVLKEKDLLYLVEGGVAIAAGFFMLIGTIVFGVMRNDEKIKIAYEKFDLHAGFALCIVAALLSMGAGALFVVARSQYAKK